jgi:hypothetical protein
MRSALAHVVTALMLGLAALHSTAARADLIEVREARLEQGEDALLLSADFQFDFNPRLEQVVANGVPLYFVVEFELTRPRWYWFDEKAAVRRLQTRLSYHALTRQYRLSRGLLHQNFNTLQDALAVLRRVRNWPVLERAASSPESSYQAAIRMRLDIALLPKPFQVSALTSREWHLESDWTRFTYRVPAASSPAPAASEKREERRDDRTEGGVR